MVKAFGFVLIGLVIISQVNLSETVKISDIQNVINFAIEMIGLFDRLDVFSILFSKSSSSFNATIDVLKQIDELSDQARTLGNQLNNNMNILLDTLLVRIPLEGKLDNDVKDLRRYIVRIDYLYSTMTEFLQEDYGNIDNHTLNYFIDAVMSLRAGDVPDVINNMFYLVVPRQGAVKRESLLELLVKQQNVNDNNVRCDLNISFQYRLYKFYNAIVITESKAYFMTLFSIKLRQYLEGMTLGSQIERFENRFVMRIEQYLLELKKEISKTSREIYRCQIDNYIPDETYTELRGLFSSYVMNVQQFDEDCYYECHKIPMSSYHLQCQESYCTQHRCNGKYFNCEWIGGRIQLCENNKGDPRRYKYIYSFGNERYYGQWSDCSDGKYYDLERVRLTGFFWERNCHQCLCQCVENSGSSTAIRTFSLIPQYTDIDSNMVVSDIRFVLKDNVIHLQIEQSPLLPDGYLNRSLSSWVPLPDLKYKPTGEGTFVMMEGFREIPLKRYQNFTFIDREPNVIYLDEISAGSGHVITGVRLNHEKPSQPGKANTSPIQLEIYALPFDLETGQLIDDGNRQKWISPMIQPNLPRAYTIRRKELIYGKDVTSFKYKLHNPNLKPNLYMKFGRSSIVDGGQYTVPFIDLRSVDNGNNLAINGIGLFYYDGDNKAGYISPKLLTIDLSTLLNPEMTLQQIDSYSKYFWQPLTHAIPKDVEQSD